MTRPARLETALKRLGSALDQLDAAADRLAKAGAERRDLEDTLAVMQDDRSRLAQDLDAALSRGNTLEHASNEVSARLGKAGTALRHLLATTEARDL